MTMIPPIDRASLAKAVVAELGGRFSTGLGIDLDAGDVEIGRWFLAATLFGARISVATAERAFHALEQAGITGIGQASERTWTEIVELLDAAGYTRYDYRTATRLQALARIIRRRWAGSVGEIGRRHTDPVVLAVVLESLPGWGPVTVRLFLRELRGVWPGADLPLDDRAARAGHHIGMLDDKGGDELEQLTTTASRAGLDARDLEAALVRLSLRHRRPETCPGGTSCVVLERARTGSQSQRRGIVG